MDEGTHLDQQRYIGASDPHEAERLAAQAAGGLDELRAALTGYALPVGARVLELGCGAGTFTRALLALLPPGTTIVATDSDARLLDVARATLALEAQTGRVRFALADAAHLPYRPQSFELVACRCLLMHQTDPLGVVAEMFRVATVGGLALAIEPDWGARALYPDSEALSDLLALARRAQPYGFPNLLMGRTLYALLRTAGFVGIHVHPSAFVETAADHAVSQSVGDTLEGPGRLLDQARVLLRRAEIADDATIDALIARFAAAQRHLEYFSAGLDFAATGEKPALTWP